MKQEPKKKRKRQSARLLLCGAERLCGCNAKWELLGSAQWRPAIRFYFCRCLCSVFESPSGFITKRTKKKAGF